MFRLLKLTQMIVVFLPPILHWHETGPVTLRDEHG